MVKIVPVSVHARMEHHAIMLMGHAPVLQAGWEETVRKLVLLVDMGYTVHKCASVSMASVTM